MMERSDRITRSRRRASRFCAGRTMTAPSCGKHVCASSADRHGAPDEPPAGRSPAADRAGVGCPDSGIRHESGLRRRSRPALFRPLPDGFLARRGTHADRACSGGSKTALRLGAVTSARCEPAFRDPSAHDWHFFVLLAGLHLLHVLATLTLAHPWRSWVQLAAIRPPLHRYLAVQVPVQIVALLTLALLAPGPDGSAHVTVPAVGIAGAAALVLITLRLIVPMLREKARTGAA